MHIANTMLIELVPVVVNKPCRAGSLRDLMSIPEDKIHITVKLLTMLAENTADFQRGGVASRIAGHPRLPCIQMGADKQKFIACPIASKDRCRLMDDAPGAVCNCRYFDLDLLSF